MILCENCHSPVRAAGILCPVCDRGVTRRVCGVRHAWPSGETTECVLRIYPKGPHQGISAWDAQLRVSES